MLLDDVSDEPIDRCFVTGSNGHDESDAYVSSFSSDFKEGQKNKIKKYVSSKLSQIAANSNTLVANTNVVKFDRGLFVSGSTGRSSDYKRERKRLDTVAPKADKPKRSKSMGESRQRVVANAMQQSTNRVKVLVDKAIAEDRAMWFQTVTFDPRMSLEYVIDAVNRIRFMFKRKCKDFVFVWGIGEEPKTDEDGCIIPKNRLHLHIHVYSLAEDKDVFKRQLKKCMTEDERFKEFRYFLHSEQVSRSSIRKKVYALAIYAAKNLQSFKPDNLRKLVEQQVYSQQAIEELDNCREQMRLYKAGAKVNWEFSERSTKYEQRIKPNGLDACNQVLLRVAKVHKVYIEKMDVVCVQNGQKFYANYDRTTRKSYARVISKEYVPGTLLPLAMYRAWTLHKEKGYEISTSFDNFVNSNPAVLAELETKRISRLE